MTTGINQERSRTVAKAIENAMASALQTDTSGVVAVFNACRTRLLAEPHDKVEGAEIARRIAEAKVSVLFEREDAGDEFFREWNELERLGFASLEREASMLVYFVRFIDRTNGADGRDRQGAVDRLGKLIRQMAESGNVSLADHFSSLWVKFSSAGQ